MERVTKNRKLVVGAAFVAVLLALGAGQACSTTPRHRPSRCLGSRSIRSGRRPMPNNYVMGMTIGIGISSDDHVLGHPPR